MTPDRTNRRTFLRLASAGAGALALGTLALAQPKADEKKTPTRFQIACMTLPYSQFPLERALTGIKAAGYQFVAWGTSHKEDGKSVPVLAADAAPEKAKELATRCRDMGLEPLMMFSGIYPEAKNGL